MKALEVIRPGPRTLVEDGGRHGLRRMGVPVGGAADAELWRLTQAVAGGPGGAAALEFAMQGPKLRVVGGAARIAIGGAEGRIETTGGDRIALPALRSATLAEGDVLDVGLATAAVGYLCVEGGIDVREVLGSRSTDLRAGFGGFEGRPLRAGDRVALAGEPPRGPERAAAAPPPAQGPLRTVLGPQRDHFTDQAVEAFLSAEWRVTDDVDRMGVRLSGPRLEHAAKGADIMSEGLTIGAIQVPGAGQPIALGVESHTIGGYPKIATVITADLPRLGRLRPGDAVRFAAVDAGGARQALRAARAALDRALAGVAPWRGAGTPDLAALASRNLVSGVVDARRAGEWE